MPYVCAIGSCLFAGIAVGIIAAILCEKPAGRRRRKLRGIGGYIYAWMEYAGHRPFFVKLSRKPRIERTVTRICNYAKEKNVEISPYGCTAACVFGLAIAALAGLFLARSILGIPVGMVLAVVCAATVLGRHDRNREAQEADQMPEVLRTLSSALGAGKSLSQAIDYAGRNLAEPMGSEFLKASFEMTGGRSVEEAVNSLCDRVNAPGTELMATALCISQRTGSPLDDLFSRTARMVTDTISLQRELEVKTSQARLSAKIVSVMPLILMCVLTIVSPDYRAGLATPVGSMCICLAAVLDITAFVLIKSFMGEGSS